MEFVSRRRPSSEAFRSLLEVDWVSIVEARSPVLGIAYLDTLDLSTGTRVWYDKHLPYGALISVHPSEWNKPLGGQPVTRQREMRKCTMISDKLDVSHLWVWGPKYPLTSLLDTLKDMTARSIEIICFCTVWLYSICWSIPYPVCEFRVSVVACNSMKMAAVSGLSLLFNTEH